MQIQINSGFLLIDKPAGISSFDVIRQLRKKTGIRTFGHAGTLDPFATGLLIIAVNKYTRLLPLLDNADKSYTATIVLGSSSSTGDPEGEITRTDDKQITQHDLDLLKEQVLNITAMKPPIYSAIKVDGKRAYARARASEEFELPARASTIHEFEILSFEYPRLTYTCRVSKGTYIRSLSEKIAEFLGTFAYTIALKRTAIGRISLDKAVALDDINEENLPAKMATVHDLIPGMENIVLQDDEIVRIRNGNSITNNGTDDGSILIFNAALHCLGIVYRKDNMLFPKVNLC